MQPLSSSARRLVASRPIPNTIRQQFRLRSSLSRPSFVLRQRPSPRLPSVPFQRHNSSLTVPEGQPATPVSDDVPSYHLSFTCKPCLHRSRHRITKQGYHYGTVLVTCPSCKARHVIADHLKVFLDQKKTLEDILREKLEEGQDFTKLLKKGTLGIRPGSLVGNEGEEDLEFWEDGAETKHKPLVGVRYHAGEESENGGSVQSRRDDDD